MIVNTIDITILIIIAIFSLLGFYWGLIRQLLSVVFLIAGVIFAGQYYQSVAGMLSFVTPNINIGDIIGFLIIVTSINMVGLLLSSKLPLNFLFFGMSDRVIGSVIGFFQGGITATVLIAIIAANPNDQISEMLRDSQFTTVILKYFKFVLALMPMMLRQSMEIFFGGL